VCVREREREREGGREREREREGGREGGRGRFTTLGKIYNIELDLHHQICTDVL